MWSVCVLLGPWPRDFKPELLIYWAAGILFSPVNCLVGAESEHCDVNIDSESFTTKEEIYNIYCKLDGCTAIVYLNSQFYVMFTQVKEYDTISRLDQWLTTMLLRIKKTIQEDESDLR